MVAGERFHRDMRGVNFRLGWSVGLRRAFTMTGNQAWEPRFVNSLSPEDRVLYNQAKSEQRELMKKYHTLRAAMASRQTPMARAMTP